MKYRVRAQSEEHPAGLATNQSFYWNRRNYRAYDILTADDSTDPEALRHLLHYPDCLVTRGVVEPITETETKAAPASPVLAEEE